MCVCFEDLNSYLNTEERFSQKVQHASEASRVHMVTKFQNDITVRFRIAAIKLHFRGFY